MKALKECQVCELQHDKRAWSNPQEIIAEKIMIWWCRHHEKMWEKRLEFYKVYINSDSMGRDENLLADVNEFTQTTKQVY
jgi:hypothetical protein